VTLLQSRLKSSRPGVLGKRTQVAAAALAIVDTERGPVDLPTASPTHHYQPPAVCIMFEHNAYTPAVFCLWISRRLAITYSIELVFHRFYCTRHNCIFLVFTIRKWNTRAWLRWKWDTTHTSVAWRGVPRHLVGWKPRIIITTDFFASGSLVN
jgi:hypothetical protein